MTNETNGISIEITIDNKKLETVCSFNYLGAIVSDEGSKSKVLSRIVQTTAAVTKLKVIWKDKSIAISSKIRLMRSLVMSIFLHACETFTITADFKRRIQALEMTCFCKLLGISCRDHITNEGVKTKIETCNEKTQAEVVRACPAIIRTGQDCSTDEEAHRVHDGKTTSKSELALNGTSYCGKLRTIRNGGSWL